MKAYSHKEVVELIKKYQNTRTNETPKSIEQFNKDIEMLSEGEIETTYRNIIAEEVGIKSLKILSP